MIFPAPFHTFYEWWRGLEDIWQPPTLQMPTQVTYGDSEMTPPPPHSLTIQVTTTKYNPQRATTQMMTQDGWFTVFHPNVLKRDNVTRFLTQVFFHDFNTSGPLFICWSIFANGLEFVEIIACAKYFAVSLIPRIQAMTIASKLHHVLSSWTCSRKEVIFKNTSACQSGTQIG